MPRFTKGKKARIIRRREIIVRLNEIVESLTSLHFESAPSIEQDAKFRAYVREHRTLTYELIELAAFDDAGWQKE